MPTTLKEELALLSSKGTWTWGPWCLGPVNVSSSAKLEVDPGGKMYTLNVTDLSVKLCLCIPLNPPKVTTKFDVEGKLCESDNYNPPDRTAAPDPPFRPNVMQP
eukprot:5924642-Prymnesium_polylepis.1